MVTNGKTRSNPIRESRTFAPQALGSLRSQSGQTLMEVALLTPLLLLLVIGGIELGRYAYLSILVGNAARAGAAFGAQTLAQSVSAAGIAAAADNDFQNNGQNVATLAVNSAVTCGCDNDGAVTAAVCSTAANSNAGTCATGHWVVMVSVTASGTFNSLFNFPRIPKNIAISRTSTMRVAQE
jgi:Flp pilus assembly protein TadG